MKWNVFPAGRMCSLRRALLLWLVPLFLVVGCAAAALAWWSYARMVGGFMDDQMQQLASAVAANPGVQPMTRTRSGSTSGGPTWSRCTGPTAGCAPRPPRR
jgi:hypothetical protein